MAEIVYSRKRTKKPLGLTNLHGPCKTHDKSPPHKFQVIPLQIFEGLVSQCIIKPPIKLDRCNLLADMPDYDPLLMKM